MFIILKFNNFLSKKSIKVTIAMFLLSILIICVNIFINGIFYNSDSLPEPPHPNDSDTTLNSDNENPPSIDNQAEKMNAINENNAPNIIQNNTPEIKNEETEDYRNLYPELYCQRPQKQYSPNKTIFLTFDDGPSERTSEILDILKQKNIKATFFVTGKASNQGKALMKRIVDEGHTIGIHTYSHAFRQIYSSISAYLDDFNKIYNLIVSATGVKPTIFRFPGGSKNNFNKSIYRELITEMTRRGFDYFDWNLSAGDAVSRTPTPKQTCIKNILNSSNNYSHSVVLMHDLKPKYTTVQALPEIIDGLINQGFSFDKLTNAIDPAPYSLVKPYR